MPAKPRTLREKAAQLVFARIGSNMPPPVTVAEDAARVEALLERCPLGGLVLFNGRMPDTVDVLARLQEQSPFPLLVATDMERGVGQQVRGATVFPHAMAFSAIREGAEKAVEEAARVSAREALACGIHMAFAPVADVNRDPRNPIIATRAFGTEPEQVARLVGAYIRGCRSEGLLTTAKHFPGHGATSRDSHAELPIVADARSVLERTDLVPFRAAVEAGVDAIMTAHVAYPALDPSGLPATASPVILDTLLRQEIGFRGPVITDSLLMGAVRSEPNRAGDQAADLVRAGVDVLLDAPDPEAAVEGLVRAVERGRIPESRLEEAWSRVWMLKQRMVQRFGASVFTDPGRFVTLDQVGSPPHRAVAEKVAQQAVVLQGGSELPALSPDRVRAEGMLVLLVQSHRSRLDPSVQPLAEALSATYPEAQYEELGPEVDDARMQRLLQDAERVRYVVLALVVKPAAWHRFGLLDHQHRFVQTLTERRAVILASLGSPYILDDYPRAVVRLCTFSDVPVSQQALVTALFRGVPGLQQQGITTS